MSTPDCTAIFDLFWQRFRRLSCVASFEFNMLRPQRKLLCALRKKYIHMYIYTCRYTYVHIRILDGSYFDVPYMQYIYVIYRIYSVTYRCTSYFGIKQLDETTMGWADALTSRNGYANLGKSHENHKPEYNAPLASLSPQLGTAALVRLLTLSYPSTKRSF